MKLSLTNLGLNYSPDSLKQLLLSNGWGTNKSDFINGVHKEIGTEEEIRKLLKQLHEIYERLSKKWLGDTEEKRKKTLDNFEEVKKWVEEFMTNSQKGGGGLPDGINQEKRTAVKNMHGFHHELNEEQQKLFQSFSKLPKDSPQVTMKSVPEIKQPIHPREKIQDALKMIHWDKETIKIWKNDENWTNTTKHEWGQWPENPYGNFYDKEEDYMEDLRGLGKSAGWISELKRRIGIMKARWGNQFWGHLAAELRDLVSRKDSSSSLIAMQVVVSLLKSMGKMSNSTIKRSSSTKIK